MSLKHHIAGLLAAALAIMAYLSVPHQAAAQEKGAVSLDFADWNFANEAGQRALRRGDVETAASRFRNAIEVARLLAVRDPRPLARSYTDYAVVLVLQGRAHQADPLAQWALTVREERFGKDSVQVATTLHVLTLITSAQMQYPRAEAYLTRALGIWEARLGPDHPLIAVGQNDLATLYLQQRKYAQAEAVFRQVLDSPSSRLHDRAISLIGVASLYLAQGQLERVESTNQELMVVLRRLWPQVYPAIAPSLEQYLAQLRKQGHSAQAQALEDAARRARTGEGGVSPELRKVPRAAPPIRTRST
jgi:tetratricopeptide (TPR) repeat protein